MSSAPAADGTAQPGASIVVVRGPAGAGKSTVSAAVLALLRGASPPRRVAYLEQDYFRNTACGGGKGAREAARDMLLAAARAAVAAGYLVLLEGILSAPHHAEALAALGREAGGLACVYLDVPLEETKARHAGRAKSAEFGGEKLEEWWSSSAPLGCAGELRIGRDSALSETAAAVVALFGSGGGGGGGGGSGGAVGGAAAGGGGGGGGDEGAKRARPE